MQGDIFEQRFVGLLENLLGLWIEWGTAENSGTLVCASHYWRQFVLQENDINARKIFWDEGGEQIQ